MGSELIFPIAMVVAAVLFALLCYLVSRVTSRPFALPTLLAALVWAWHGVEPSGSTGRYLGSFCLEFATGATLFGLHGLAIRVAWGLKSPGSAAVLEEQDNSGSPPPKDA